jgi:hypothetical protein
MSSFYGMYFRNAAEEAQVPRLGSGWWWRVAAYSGCKVFHYELAQAVRIALAFFDKLDNQLGDCHGQPIFPIDKTQRAQRL